MRSSTLVAVFVVGASGVASGEPKPEEISGRVRIDDDVRPRQHVARQPGDWVELASATPAAHGTEYVLVGKEAGAFSRLRLDAVKGRTIVHKVRIHFTDGKTKTLLVDRALTKKRKSTTVELGTDRTIDRIVVWTETYTRGEYAIYGSSGAGGATVVGAR